MILVTLGTHGQPMRRLVPALERIAAELPHLGPFEMQHGATKLPSGWEGSPLIAPRRLASLMDHADLVITHGGPATIAEVRAAGTIPIVVPRRSDAGEHVDDHQLDYARRLAHALEIVLVERADDLVDVVANFAERAATLPRPEPHDAGPAAAAVAAVVDRLLGR